MNFEQDLKGCSAALDNGGIILYPTDTIWGLGCDARDAAAVEKVFALKARPANKSMVILLADAQAVQHYVDTLPEHAIAAIDEFSKPTTVIYEGAKNLAENVINEDGSIAIRVTSDPFCKALIREIQAPLVATSANLSGAPSPLFFPEISMEIIRGADYVVRYRQNETTPGRASRIVRISQDGTLVILRP